MADEGTLATTAEVLLAIGQDASAAQILETNTNIWIKWAEGDMSVVCNIDLVANYASISTNWKRYFAQVAANRAAFYAINQDQNNWTLATSQSKLNVFDASWKKFVADMEQHRGDILETVGL
jgi:hypothetical protein